MTLKSLLSIIFAGLLSALYVCLRIYRAPHQKKLTEYQMTRLLALAEKSLESLDVPVGALLIYHDEIIGEGCNTVLRESDAGGHAEINALSDAIERLGMEQFLSLDRTSLYLVTTFEPCLMCTGAFLNYNIKQIYFLKAKDFIYLAKGGARFIRYYFRRGKMTHNGEQDSLFERHPHYPQRKIRSGAPE